MLLEFEKWLRGINESAADSLIEAFEDILTLHRLKVPALLRKTLTCTNPIESMFSTVRDCEGNIKRYRCCRARRFPPRPWSFMIAPSSAGAPADVMSRAIAARLGTALGRNIVVDNRPGAVGHDHE